MPIKLLSKLITINKPAVLGIDISDSSVKVVSLIKDGQSYSLDAYARISLPKNAVLEKEIKEIDTVAACLKEAIVLSRTSAKYGAVALADSLMITKLITVQNGLSASELEEQVMFEADKHIPYPLDEIRMDYYPLENLSPTTETQSIFIAASRSVTVDAYIQVLEKAGLTLKLIDVESFVMQKACLAFVEGFNKSEIIAVVDVGTTRTTMVVYDQGMPIFTRTELFGNELLTKDISAENLDYQNYVDKPEQHLYEAFKRSLVQHLKRALQFYSSTAETKSITKIILSGGVAILSELDQVLKDEFKIPIIIVDPVAKLKLGKKVNPDLVHRASASLMIALGLVLRSFD